MAGWAPQGAAICVSGAGRIPPAAALIALAPEPRHGGHNDRYAYGPMAISYSMPVSTGSFMKKYDIYCAGFWMLLAIFEVCLSLKLNLGSLKYPGPGFFPIIIGVVLLFLSSLLLIMAARGKKTPHYNQFPPFPGKVWLICALMFVYSFLLEFFGYIASTTLLLFYLFKYPASKKWGEAILMSAIVVILTYYFFGVLLDAQFPKGIFKIK